MSLALSRDRHAAPQQTTFKSGEFGYVEPGAHCTRTWPPRYCIYIEKKHNLYPITQPNVNRFSHFIFHLQISTVDLHESKRLSTSHTRVATLLVQPAYG